MKLKSKIIEFYGNRGYKFDLFISIIIILFLVFIKIDFGFVDTLLNNIDESTISFFGILIGFLLTTFSLLFLYNPEHSEDLMRLRKLKQYKNMLYTFISTAFILIILTIFLIAFNIFKVESSTISIIIFGIILFSLLRILKCIFYLFAIIELS